MTFCGVLALMIWFLLDPSSLLNLMQSSVPAEARTIPPRYPHFSVLVIFITGIGFFYMMEAGGVIHTHRPPDRLQFWLLGIAACFFGANGVWACYWPISFMRRCIPQLGRMQGSALSEEAERTFSTFGKCLGVVLILLCSYLVHVIGVAAS